MLVLDTIASECTASYKSALSVVRLAGPLSFEILSKMINKDVKDLEERKAYYVSLYDNKDNKDSLIDKCLIVTFKGKNSFCGEDTVEFYVHGSRIIVNELLDSLVNKGARRALGGEFSAKAFYNGKMDLSEAEAINQLINSRTVRSKDYALKVLDGNTSKTIKDMKDKLNMLSAEIETDIDYPEYEDDKTLVKKAEDLVDELRKTIDPILSSSKQSMFLFDGVKVAIIGEPNVGKSTLLNKILGEDKAIVTPIPGTTRDIVEGEKEIDGILYKFFDTAGIRKKAGEIEKIGIEKSYQAVKDADIILVLSEKGNTLSEELSSLKMDEKKPTIFISTKRDLKGSNSKADISISKDDSTLDELYKLIQKKLDLTSKDEEGLASKRDIDLLTSFSSTLKSIKEDIDNKMTIDVVEVKLIEATHYLDSILGVESTLEDIYSTVFKYFCVGK